METASYANKETTKKIFLDG